MASYPPHRRSLIMEQGDPQHNAGPHCRAHPDFEHATIAVPPNGATSMLGIGDNLDTASLPLGTRHADGPAADHFSLPTFPYNPAPSLTAPYVELSGLPSFSYVSDPVLTSTSYWSMTGDSTDDPSSALGFSPLQPSSPVAEFLRSNSYPATATAPTTTTVTTPLGPSENKTLPPPPPAPPPTIRAAAADRPKASRLRTVSRRKSLSTAPTNVSSDQSNNSQPTASNPSSETHTRNSRNQRHNNIEKEYRSRLNASFQRLFVTLPPEIQQRGGSGRNGGVTAGGEKRMRKAEVLEEATRRILELERERDDLLQKRRELLAEMEGLHLMLRRRGLVLG